MALKTNPKHGQSNNGEKRNERTCTTIVQRRSSLKKEKEEQDENGVGTFRFGEDGGTKSPDIEENKPNRDQPK